MTDINTTLQERGDRYGSFKGQARLSQDFKRVMISSKNWCHLEDHQKEGLEMIVHKIARALNGDENYIENYRDIAGYSQLILNELLLTNGATDSKVIKMLVVDRRLVEDTLSGV